MPDSPPRLDTAPAVQTRYAPVSWTAVASLAVGLLFVTLLAVLGGIAFSKKQPLIYQWLFLFPLVAVVLAFTARRQILTSEGTRTGLSLAAAGWWLGVLGGLGYGAYLFGIDFVIRNDAQREFNIWAKLIQEYDPTDPKDRKLHEAIYRAVPPQSRSQVKGQQDYDGIDKVLRTELTGLRQSDIVRIAGRNRGAVEFAGFGVRDWQQTNDRIECTLTSKMITPEGEHGLAIPMKAQVGSAGRQWQIGMLPTGIVQSKALTRYGWIIEQVEASGREFAAEFIQTVRSPNQQWAAYLAFTRASEERVGLIGAAAAGCPVVVGRDTNYYESGLAGGFYTRPDGSEPTADERARFRHVWESGSVFGPGVNLKDSPDVNPVLKLNPAGFEFRVPIELGMSGGRGMPTEAARGKLVIQAAQPELIAELTRARDAGGPRTTEPPRELLSRPVLWRVVRIESDMKPLPTSAPSSAAGGPQ